MPYCVVCGLPLVCNRQETHPAPKPPGEAVQPCPLKKGAIWVHVIDDETNNVQSANVTAVGQKPTDPNGIATYDPLDAGTYKVDLMPLTATLAKKYELPETTTESVGVSNGQITYVVFQVTRLAKLKVKVTQKGKKPEKPLGNIGIKVTGKADLGEKKTGSSDGRSDFGTVKSGDYTITVVLSEADAKIYKQPDPVSVTISPGEDKEVPIELVKIVWVKVLLKFKDDQSNVPEAKFSLFKGEDVPFADPIKDGLVEAKELDDDKHEISFPEIHADEWEPA